MLKIDRSYWMRGNLNGICGGVWSEFASHAMLRRGSADGQEEGGAKGQVGGAGGGAEPQVNGIKRGKWGFRWSPKIRLALVRFPCRHQALLRLLASKTMVSRLLPRLSPRFIAAGQSISSDSFGAFPALGSAPVFWTARGFWV